MSTETIAVPKTKTALKKLLAEERKAERSKTAQREFRHRTKNTYSGMQRRIEKLRGLKELPFSLDEFRSWVEEGLEAGCHFCHCAIKPKTMSADHYEPLVRGGGVGLDNLRLTCRPCNFRKGQMDGEQFKSLVLWVDEHLAEPEKSDFWRRLTIGGKWGVRVGGN